MRMTNREYRDRHRRRQAGEVVPDARKRPRKHPTTGGDGLTAELARRLIRYDAETGIACWKPRGQPDWDARLAGKQIGRPHDGYLSFIFDDRHYLLHRVIWLMVTGEWPSQVIDHVDCNGLDNRWSNLRQATISQNGGNKRARANRRLPKGVIRVNGTYRAQIKVENKSFHLGVFVTPELAHQAYVIAARKHFGEFARAA